jgi:hypothetical protein
MNGLIWLVTLPPGAEIARLKVTIQPKAAVEIIPNATTCFSQVQPEKCRKNLMLQHTENLAKNLNKKMSGLDGILLWWCE